MYVLSPALGTMLRSLDTKSSNGRVSYGSMNVENIQIAIIAGCILVTDSSVPCRSGVVSTMMVLKRIFSEQG